MSVRILRTATMAVACVALVATASMAQDRTGWPASFTVGTASQGGTYFVYGAGFANLVSEELGINGGGEVTGGPVQNATLVQTGQHQFGMVTMGPAYEAWVGESPLMPGVRHDKLRAMFPMYQTPFHAIALARSGVTSLDQLAGKTFGVGPAGGTPGTYWPRIMDALDIPVTARFGGAADLAGQLQDGLIDGFGFAAGVPIAAFSQILAQVDGVVYGPSEDQIPTLLEEFPSLAPFTIEPGTYSGQTEPIETVAMWNFFITSSDMPESLVYEMTRIAMTEHERMMSIHSASAETLPENYIHNTFLPFHPGAVRWFEENGYEIPDELRG
ncbi:MAG: TAXI family TRAP transporter solute-binding subunit [Rhodospirillales bacterium]|nr:MAG: TAXI family TRAP transporter solute-binding subunit [Rhodospirillales bacterium]